MLQSETIEKWITELDSLNDAETIKRFTQAADQINADTFKINTFIGLIRAHLASLNSSDTQKIATSIENLSDMVAKHRA